jgi:predicted AlkP superfamily phosphohydrolase/phosphomutase/Flp pilus assembly protein TadD
MNRRLIVLLVAAILMAAIFVGTSIERVPDGSEAVRVSRDGTPRVLEAGWHLVIPGTALHVYPVGVHTLRVPESGAMKVRRADGSAGAAYFRWTLSIPPGASLSLYERFSTGFDAALRRLAVDAAEITAATWTGDLGEAYRAAVTRAVAKELAFARISVADSGSDDAGGDAGGLPASVEVVPAARRLIIVGVDGGDWLNIQPMVDAGRLPNFAKLLAEGATGPLRSIDPMLSPLLWTTMATGRYPEDHGILNFTVVDPETGARAPISRLYRQVDAWWNMLSDAGRSVAVAGWLATDPAEPVNGVIVTDKIGYLAYATPGEERKTSSVYPPGRFDEIAGMAVSGDDVDYEEIDRFIHIGRDEFEHHRTREYDPRDPVNNLILLYATTRTYDAVAHHLLEGDSPDVLAVYFELVDAVSHLFMLHAPPRMSGVPEEEFARYRDAVDAAYELQDEIIGRFMDSLGDDTVLMVISDHGFKSGESRLRNRPEIWAGNAAKWHRPDGIVALFGNGVKRGFRIREASILDIAPTVLALQGLPRAADMPGKILATAFESGVQDRFNPNTVATLDREREVNPALAQGGEMDEQAMKKLEALGYLTPDNADAHNNLGQRYQERGEFLRAIEEYKKAIAMRPDFHSAWNNMAVCYGKLKQYEHAEEALRKTIEIKPDDFYAMNNLAVMYLETRDFDRGLAMANRCVEAEPGYVNGRITLGSALAMTGQLDAAEVQFKEALRLEPDNRTALTNLERLEQQRSMNR